MHTRTVEDATYSHAATADEAVALITGADRVYIEGPLYLTVRVGDYDRESLVRAIIWQAGYVLTREERTRLGSDGAVYSAVIGQHLLCWVRSNTEHGSIWGGE